MQNGVLVVRILHQALNERVDFTRIHPACTLTRRIRKPQTRRTIPFDALRASNGLTAVVDLRVVAGQ
jgi:hypothetical protein